MRVSILFSAGLDSTYLVWKAINDPTIKEIRLIYIKIKNNREKTVVEKIQIRKLLDIFKKYDLSRKISSSMDEISIQAFNYGYQLPQLPTILLAATSAMSKYNNEIWIGYIMGDDAISYLDEIKSIWEINKAFVVDEAKHTKLVFPLVQLKKMEIAYKLPADILKETFTCEAPTIIDADAEIWKECGECQTCKRDQYAGVTDYKKLTCIPLGIELSTKNNNTKKTEID